ncbi:TPA: hypothetical protein DCE37_06130 [Candidatus Latescibacteria bacterium]|nr:hypothetical protein [Candidatus Latescibacterota bacterium]
MRGHIVKRKGKMGLRYYTVPAEGEARKWEKVESCRPGKPASWADAEAALINRLASQQSGATRMIKEITFVAFIDIWMAQYGEIA